MSRLAMEEQFIMNWAGKILEAVGIGGAVATFFVCFFFDRLAGRLIIQFGWAQLLGLFGGVIFFTWLALFGVTLDRFLQTVKEGKMKRFWIILLVCFLLLVGLSITKLGDYTVDLYKKVNILFKINNEYFEAFKRITHDFKKGVVNLDYQYQFIVDSESETIGSDNRKYYKVYVVERTKDEYEKTIKNIFTLSKQEKK